MPMVLDLTKEICDLKCEFALRATLETQEAPSCAKDGQTQAHIPGRKNAMSLKGASSRRHILANDRRSSQPKNTHDQGAVARARRIRE